MFELDPRFVDPAVAAPIYVLNGLIDSALVRLDFMERIEPNATQLFAQRVFALTAASRWNEAEKIRAEVLRRGKDLSGGFEPAMIEMFRGRPEPMLKYLDSATGQRQFSYAYFAVGCTPVLDQIATRTEFLAALRRYGVKQCPLTPAWPIKIPPRAAAPNQ